jgi:hypothetical protein
MCPEGFRVYGPAVAKGRDATKDAPTPWQSLLLQTVLQGFLGLVDAAFRASAALALLTTGSLVFSGLFRRSFDLLAYAGHVGHPSLRRVCLFASLPQGVRAQPSRRGRTNGPYPSAGTLGTARGDRQKPTPRTKAETGARACLGRPGRTPTDGSRARCAPPRREGCGPRPRNCRPLSPRVRPYPGSVRE